MKKTDFILFSGGAPGAEAEFGACAERHGIEEVNFTFDGHNDRAPPRRPRAQPRGAAGRRRQPRVRLAADAPALHRQPDDPEGAADALVPGQQRPGNLRRRRRSWTTAPCAAARAGARSSRSCATSRCSSSIRRRTAGSSWTGDDWTGRRQRHAGHHAPALHRHRHAQHPGERPARDRGPVHAIVRAVASARFSGRRSRPLLELEPSREQRFELRPRSPRGAPAPRGCDRRRPCRTPPIRIPSAAGAAPPRAPRCAPAAPRALAVP